MPVTKLSLPEALEELKHVLADDAAGQGEGWFRRVNQVLETLEQILHQHRVTLQDPEGRVIDVDTALSPSPGVDRRICLSTSSTFCFSGGRAIQQN